MPEGEGGFEKKAVLTGELSGCFVLPASLRDDRGYLCLGREGFLDLLNRRIDFLKNLLACHIFQIANHCAGLGVLTVAMLF